MTPLIEIKNIDFNYTAEQPILRRIQAEIMPGQLITLLGPNGVGKSTLLNCIIGVLTPTRGEVLLNGRKLSQFSRKTIARNIAYVPQKTAVSFDYSVLEFVVMGRTSHMGFFSAPSSDDYRQSEHALEQLDLLRLKNRPISELSGGEQQKACIARAIVQMPKLIIMDEPTSALDYGNQIKVLKLVKELSASGYAVLITTHNPEHPLLLNSDVWLLERSGTLSAGTCDEMLTEEKLVKLYDTNIHVTHIDSLNRRACFIRSI